MCVRNLLTCSVAVFVLLAFNLVASNWVGSALIQQDSATPTAIDDRPPKSKQEKYRTVGKNLVANGDFAKQEQGQPAGWKQNTWSGRPVYRYLTDIGRGDKTSVHISSTDGADASWSFPVRVRPNTEYRLSAWIKTKNLDAKTGFGAQLNLHQLQLVGKTEPIKGTSDWQQLSTQFNSGDHRELLVNLLFGGWGRSTGEAWFDDVQLFELAENVPKMSETEAIAFFESKVRPILKENCLECHGDDPEDLGGELALISRKMILAGGDSGPAVSLDHPQDSLLLDAVNYGTYEMPPDGKLPQAQIDILTTWVKLGAPWSKADAEKTLAGGHKKSSVPEVNEQTKKFWSFQKVVRPEPPVVKNSDWVENEIDRFVLARLEKAGLQPAAPAAKHSLVRRVYYDLTGLPPTPQQVQDFVNDTAPDAYQKLVDRLLESPHYGEKWARHWLDIVRYAESNSFERDGTKPFIWHYRDYVIRSFNNDKPYDQFLIEQLAGDELEQPTSESILATGYYRLGQWDDEPADKEQALYDDLDDILATTSQAMLGLTVNCARCHDHKIDPIPQADYYRMLSFFSNVRRYGVRGHDTVLDASTRQVGRKPNSKEQADYEKQVNQLKSKMAEIEKIVKADFESVEHEDFQYDQNKIPLVKKRLDKKVISQQQFNEYRNHFSHYKRLRDNPPHLYRVLCVKEHHRAPAESFVMIRGNPRVKGKPVTPGFISVLSPPEPKIEARKDKTSSGRRMALAKWIADADNPMTARVMVNRIWQHHFGRGIVRSSSDFGFQGTPPTHPQLLDWLADEFVERGWSIKDMHRLILTSNTYRMSNVFNQKAYAADPRNNLFWRFDIRRLTAEELRDSILAVSGRLNRTKMYGPSFFPELSREVLAGQSRPGDGWGRSSAEEVARRSIYIHVKRSLRVPLLANFDVAETDFSCPIRFNTTQPTQALGLLNSQFTNQEAESFAKIIAGLHKEPRSQVAEILRRVTQREPAAAEIDRGLKLLQSWQEQDGVSKKRALTFYCLLAFNLNEFIYVD